MRRIEKPWGHEVVWAETAHYVGKILVIRAGEALSLQYHRVKEETLLGNVGECEVLIEQDDGSLISRVLRKGDVQHVAPGRRHRLIGRTDCEVLEVSTPHLDDVVRLDDRYDRAR
ncbi:cupin [Myxococcota bacterium]|nr:cupin [Myxococcota bacterium]